MPVGNAVCKLGTIRIIPEKKTQHTMCVCAYYNLVRIVLQTCLYSQFSQKINENNNNWTFPSDDMYARTVLLKILRFYRHNKKKVRFQCAIKKDDHNKNFVAFLLFVFRAVQRCGESIRTRFRHFSMSPDRNSM